MGLTKLLVSSAVNLNRSRERALKLANSGRDLIFKWLRSLAWVRELPPLMAKKANNSIHVVPLCVHWSVTGTTRMLFHKIQTIAAASAWGSSRSMGGALTNLRPTAVLEPSW